MAQVIHLPVLKARERRRDFVCSACLHEQHTFLRPCERCGARRLEHVAFKRQQHGEHWKELLRADAGEVN